MPPTELTDAQRQALEIQLHKVRDSSNTPEAFGWAIANAVLTEAASKGTVNGNLLEVPLTLSVSLPTRKQLIITPSMAAAGADEPITGVASTVTVICTRTCVTIFGVELICTDDCHTETITTS